MDFSNLFTERWLFFQ